MLYLIPFVNDYKFNGGMEKVPCLLKVTRLIRTFPLLSATVPLPAENNIINLKVVMSLGAFNVLVCEQNCNIADIKIQGRTSRPSSC